MNDAEPKTTLIVVNEVAHFSEFRKLIERILLRNKHIVIVFEREGYNAEEMFRSQIEICKNLGWQFVIQPTSNPPDDGGKGALFLARVRYVLEKAVVPKLIANLFVGCISAALYPTAVFRLVRRCRRRVKAFTNLLQHLRVGRVVLGEYNVLLDSFVYETAAVRCSVPLYVYPYTIPNPSEMRGGARYRFPIRSARRLAAQLFLRPWLRIFEDGAYLLLPVRKIAAIAGIRGKVPDPWILNNSQTASVLVESERMKGIYAVYGCKSENLIVTGTANDDILYEKKQSAVEERRAFLERHGLSEKPIILLAIPPSQYPRAEAEFGTYTELLENLADTLGKFGMRYNLAAVPHPKSAHTFSVFSDRGIQVVNEPVVNLIPFAHLYIAVSSATIRWAIAMSVPVINYDVYKYNYSDYLAAPGVLHVFSRWEFDQALHQMNDDPVFYQTIAHAQAADAANWGRIDGKAVDRLTAAMKIESVLVPA